jgi:hypothetical protein
MKRIGHAGFAGAVVALLAGHLVGSGRDPGPGWAVLLVLSLAALGALVGSLVYALHLQRRSVELRIDGTSLAVLRGGEEVERYPLADLEVECFADPYSCADDGRFWMGATLILPGRRTIDVRTSARRSELEGLKHASTGGLLLSQRSYRALIGAVRGGRRVDDRPTATA